MSVSTLHGLRRVRASGRTIRTAPFVSFLANNLTFPPSFLSLTATFAIPNSLDWPPSILQTFPLTLCNTSSPSSPSPGAVKGFAPGVCARESVSPAVEGAEETAGGAEEAVNEKGVEEAAAGAEVESVEVETGGAVAKEKPVVVFAAWPLLSDAGAPEPNAKPVEPVEPPEPMFEPNAKPVLRPAVNGAGWSLSFVWRAAPKPNEGGEEEPNEVAMGGDEAGLAENREVEAGVEKGVGPPKVKAGFEGVSVELEDVAALPKEKAVDAGAVEVDVAEPNENGDPDEPNENAGLGGSFFSSCSFTDSCFSPSSFFASPSFSPFAIFPNCAPNENPPLGFCASSPPVAPFSGVVGGLTLSPNRSGLGFEGGLVSLAGASFGAEGGLSSSRLDDLAGADDEGAEVEGADEEELAAGNVKELFSTLGAESGLKTNPPAGGAEFDELLDVDLTALPAKAKTAGGAGGAILFSAGSSDKSAMGTGLGGFLKMSGMSSAATVAF